MRRAASWVVFVAYFAFPAAQALILASAPLLLALACPISMLLMMVSMRGSGMRGSGCGHGQAGPRHPAPEQATGGAAERAREPAQR